jgi:branched-chain amino acid transport system permease protein
MELYEQLIQYLITGLTSGAIYGLLAVGFAAVYNVTGIINFAQGESAMLGALTMVWLRGRLGLPLSVAFAFTVLIVAVVGAGTHYALIRPAKKASQMTLIMITIGASIAIRGIALVIWGTDAYPSPAFTSAAPIRLGSAILRPQSLWVAVATVLSVLALSLFLRRTMLGRALRACAINRTAAQLMGIRHTRMATLSFALGAALGALAGAVVAPITYATYDMGAMLGLKGFVAAILGGLSSSTGALVGGLVLGVLEVMAAGLISSGAKDAIAFAVLLVVLFVRPHGFLGMDHARGGL